MIPVIMTTDGITLFIAGLPISVARNHSLFDEIEAAAKAGNADEVQALIEKDKRRLEDAANAIPGTQVKILDGLVMYRDIPVHDTLARRMLAMLAEGWDLVPMARFVENLMENPSSRAVTELYGFLEKGKNPITEDGCFLAFKAVNGRFFDIHSNTFDNSVGSTPSVLRNQVDEDASRTCSYGLHVCSFDYLPHFAHGEGSGHVMVVKVNPRDVVAIPADYSATKMRVCRYEVLSEYENYYQDRKDLLGLAQVTRNGSDPVFEVLALVDGSDESPKGFAVLSEAAAYAEQLIKSAEETLEDMTVRILNLHTRQVVLELVWLVEPTGMDEF